jgi:RNA polymerase primary sigma factor
MSIQSEYPEGVSKMGRYVENTDDRTEYADRETDGAREKKQDQYGARSRSLDTYLREINREPLLTREEERDLARRIRAGEKGALDRMVRANLRFVVSIAKQYANRGLSLEDLINEGNLGLIKAAHRFDEERGFKFISYAVWWIRQSILVSLADQSRIVRLPLNRAGLLYRIGKASRQLSQELGRAPAPDEIAARIDIPVEEVMSTMVLANTHVSLDDPYSPDNDETTLVDHLPADNQASTDEQTYNAALRDDLSLALGTLPERERAVLSMYFGLGGNEPMTLDSIGDELHLSRERIRQIKEKGIDRLRDSSRAQYLQGHNGSSMSSKPVLQSAGHGHRK